MGKSREDVIKPCPFCGGRCVFEVFEYYGRPATFGISCTVCGTETRATFKSKPDALDFWNARCPAPAGSTQA